MENDDLNDDDSKINHCIPRSSGIDEAKAQKMKEAIQKVFEEHNVGFDPKIAKALAYSTDISN